MVANKNKSDNVSIRASRVGYISSFLVMILLIVIAIFIEVKIRQSDLINGKTSSLLTLISISAAFIIFVYVHLMIYSKKLVISGSSLILEEGVFGKHHLTITYQNITEIGVKQDVLARLLDYGDIYINTSGQGKKELKIEKINHPLHVKKLIEAFSGLNK